MQPKIILGFNYKTNELSFTLSIFSAVLLLFINLKLGYDEDISTAIYHSYEWLTYFFAVLGAVIADSWLGLYKTIVGAEVIFAAGCILLAVGVIDVLNLPI